MSEVREYDSSKLIVKVKWSESEVKVKVKWIHFWSFKSAENFWGGSVHVGGHRYTGIFCASKVLWVYEGRLPERRAIRPAGRLPERRAIRPAALAQRRGGREATSSSLIVKVKWSESEVKWKWSESIFGPLIFFNLRYIKGGVRGNNNIGIKKCTTNFLWVLNFGQVGEIFKNFQNHTTTKGIVFFFLPGKV